MSVIVMENANSAWADTPLPTPPWESQTAADHPLVGTAWSTIENRLLTPTEVLDILTAANFVMLGEKHDNSDHHRLQTWITKNLIARGQRPALGFEMIDQDKAPLLTKPYTDADAMAAAIEWDKGWGNWDVYKPLVQTALSHDLPVLATNLPKTTIKAMGKKGTDTLTPETKSLYALDTPLSAASYEPIAKDIRDSHCNMLPDSLIPRMVDIQRAKDASMAHALSAEDSAILITGAMHARSDRGVPFHLARIAPQKSVVTLTFQEVDEETPMARDYAQNYRTKFLPFDIVWFTPRVDSEDPCEKYAEQLQKLKKK